MDRDSGVDMDRDRDRDMEKNRVTDNLNGEKICLKNASTKKVYILGTSVIGCL
jgi:hypothetical protein